ncbi:CpaF family protein [uncultured Thiodictyon sp.]|jgi:pilus assembly protein CpaF|uniref:CpaF family protein n=1 Tax=uncultured Thiodictyon sp. TaxID=1846217 RepID=UPI0025FABA8A|nr:CpaF family protein [uncultured Thiodictyon sp.]
MDSPSSRPSGLASRPVGSEDNPLHRRGLGGRLSAGPSSSEQEVKQEILQRVVKLMDLSLLANLTDTEARTQIQAVVERLLTAESLPYNIPTRQRIIKEIENEILGLGPLEGLLADPTISDILVNGADQIYLERRGKLELSNVRFDSERHLMTIIDRVVSRVGRRIDESSPMVDARLPDGSRVNVIIPPLALNGPVMSIRRFAVDRLTTGRMIELGTMTANIARVLDAVVRGRQNILISGGTGTGKTTLLNVLSGFIPADERVITIEDSAELQMQQPHVIRLETRPPNIEGRGEVTQRDLLRNSLRMRPDRIVLGEVRGAEALDMLQAMNTGHDGSLATIHANSARDGLTRIENMVAMSGINLPTRSLRAQIASALDLVVQLERHEDGRRRIVSIQEIAGLEGEVITMSEIFRFEREGLDRDGKVLGHFKATGVVPRFHEQLRRRGLDLGLEVFDPTQGD